MELTDGEFQWIVEYVRNNYGIELGQKRLLITGRLENYLIRNDYQSYGEFIQKIKNNPTGPEASNLINILTTNHTFFMREFVHFEYMIKYVLPWIREKEASSHDVRIWSAAASTGEEPYTIAMVLNDYFGLDKTWNTQLLATDISSSVLMKAKEGTYMEEQIEPLPANWKRRYFKKTGENAYTVTQKIRDNVCFRRFNLMDEITFKGKFQVVFLRNVMIYFDEDTKSALLKRIYNHMEDGGYLFIGTTESIDRTSSGFKYVRPSIYRKM